jgi:CheY-like chemotaxis protein
MSSWPSNNPKIPVRRGRIQSPPDVHYFPALGRDLGMPRQNGWQVAERIRARYSPDALRLVAITGHGGDEERARSRRAGFDAHLLKPPSPDLVESILSQFFSRPG